MEPLDCNGETLVESHCFFRYLIWIKGIHVLVNKNLWKTIAGKLCKAFIIFCLDCFEIQTLQSLSNRHLVADLSIFYRYFHGNCSQEIKNIIPDPVRCVRTTRSSTYSHPFQVTLPNPRTLAHKSSFISRTSQLWNSLPSTTPPESYNLLSFKSNINKVDLISLSTETSPFSQFFLCRDFVIVPLPLPDITY